MSRELKFRAWDKHRMIHFQDFSIGLQKGKETKPYVFFPKDTFNGEAFEASECEVVGNIYEHEKLINE